MTVSENHVHIDTLVMSRRISEGESLQGKIVKCIIEEVFCKDCENTFTRRKSING